MFISLSEVLFLHLSNGDSTTYFQGYLRLRENAFKMPGSQKLSINGSYLVIGSFLLIFDHP